MQECFQGHGLAPYHQWVFAEAMEDSILTATLLTAGVTVSGHPGHTQDRGTDLTRCLPASPGVRVTYLSNSSTRLGIEPNKTEETRQRRIS